jgi:alkanesulfonate monooxygenase SsuD/methylene tetrahydromethanopterin reductase-like flavin-dependent oxidoreductase (luciferase family)
LVACTSFHPPGLIARMAATVDELSGGRLVLGVGAGWNEVEFRAFGIPFDHRVARFAEAFEVIARLLAGERVTLEGRFHRADDAVLMPPPTRRVPVMIGATGPRILAVALPRAQVWNTWYDWYGNTPEGFAARNAEVSATAERAGRAPADIGRSACVLVALESLPGRRHAVETAAPVSGDARRVAAHLRALADAGADEAILVVHPIEERSIRALGEALEILDR